MVSEELCIFGKSGAIEATWMPHPGRELEKMAADFQIFLEASGIEKKLERVEASTLLHVTTK